MNEQDYPQGQRVHFKIDGTIEGDGRICGLSGQGVAFIGRTFIIEPDIPMDQSVYPYTHISIPEIYLTKI